LLSLRVRSARVSPELLPGSPRAAPPAQGPAMNWGGCSRRGGLGVLAGVCGGLRVSAQTQRAKHTLHQLPGIGCLRPGLWSVLAKANTEQNGSGPEGEAAGPSEALQLRLRGAEGMWCVTRVPQDTLRSNT